VAFQARETSSILVQCANTRNLMVRDVVANDVAVGFDSPIPHHFDVVTE
jgi:hypothetical protein